MTSVDIIYRPGEGDPAITIWNGYRFRANEPKPIPEDAVVAHDKSPMRMVDLARGNPHFEVAGEKRARARNAGKPGKTEKGDSATTDPRLLTSEDYRAHAVAWINAADDFDALVKQWDDEEEMRALAGVGEDDIDFLQQFYAPKHDALKKAKQATRR
jgi:hypothetical protein